MRQDRNVSDAFASHRSAGDQPGNDLAWPRAARSRARSDSTARVERLLRAGYPILRQSLRPCGLSGRESTRATRAAEPAARSAITFGSAPALVQHRQAGEDHTTTRARAESIPLTCSGLTGTFEGFGRRYIRLVHQGRGPSGLNRRPSSGLSPGIFPYSIR